MSNMSSAHPVSPSIPAGWYPDGQGRMRWWDGTAWTEQYSPATGVPVAPVMLVVRRNGLATAAMVLGIIAAVLSFTVIFIYIAMVLGVIAVILGIIGLVMAKDLGGVGIGPAWTGIVLSVIPFIFFMAVVSSISSFLRGWGM